MGDMTFCENCNCDREYAVATETAAFEIKGTKFTCPQKVARCAACGEQVYAGRLFDENNAVGHDAYRSAMGIITVAEIEELLERYDIGAVPLSRMLGWGDSTIYKQMSGAVPSRERSDKLKLLFAPEKMQVLLEQRGHLLSKVARRKAEKALAALAPGLSGREKLVLPDYLEELIHREAQKAGMPPQEYLAFVLGKGLALEKRPQEQESWNLPDIDDAVRLIKPKYTFWDMPDKGEPYDGKKEWTPFFQTSIKRQGG